MEQYIRFDLIFEGGEVFLCGFKHGLIFCIERIQFRLHLFQDLFPLGFIVQAGELGCIS